MIQPENPPAFPFVVQGSAAFDTSVDQGMSLRDYFAGQAVTGILANSENVAAGAEPTNSAISSDGFPAWLALSAYRVADAMLAHRAKAGATHA